MSGVVLAVALMIGLATGLVLGWVLGAWARGSARRYWALNVTVLVVGMALDFVGLASGLRFLSLGALGFMAGSLTGLRFAYLDTVGKMHVAPARDDADVIEEGAESAGDSPGAHGA